MLGAVLVQQQVGHLVVVDLPGKLTGLLQHQMTVLGVSEVADVCAFVEEAVAIAIDHEAEGIAMALEVGRDVQVAEIGGIALPADRVATRPVTMGLRPDPQGHGQAVAGVVLGASNLGQVPSLAQVAAAPLGIGLETTAGEHHGRPSPRL